MERAGVRSGLLDRGIDFGRRNVVDGDARDGEALPLIAPALRVAALCAALAAGACAGAQPSGSPASSPVTEGRPTPSAPAAATASVATTAAAVPAATSGGYTLETTVVADEVLLTVPGPVRPGQAALVSARTARNADCSVIVTSASGPVGGLEGRAADGAGNVSWSVAVPAGAAPGDWTVEVTCTTPSGIRAVARVTLRVQ